MNAQKVFSSILLLIIGVLMANTFMVWGDGCSGFPDVIIFALLVILYLIILITIGIVGLIKIVKDNKSLNYYPLITTVFVALLVMCAMQDNPFKSSYYLICPSSYWR